MPIHYEVLRVHISQSCFLLQYRRAGHVYIVLFAYHFFSPLTLTHSRSPFVLTSNKFSWCHVRNAAFLQDKSSTKAHKLVHNYMRAPTAFAAGVSTKEK